MNAATFRHYHGLACTDISVVAVGIRVSITRTRETSDGHRDHSDHEERTGQTAFHLASFLSKGRAVFVFLWGRVSFRTLPKQRLPKLLAILPPSRKTSTVVVSSHSFPRDSVADLPFPPFKWRGGTRLGGVTAPEQTRPPHGVRNVLTSYSIDHLLPVWTSLAPVREKILPRT